MNIFQVLAQSQCGAASANTAAEKAATGIAGSIAIVFFVIWGLIITLSLGLFIFWIVLLVDIIKREDWKDDSEKVMWLLIILLVGWIGALVYYIIVKRDKNRNK